MNLVENNFVVLPVLAYLLGSIPFGLLLGNSKGVDIRQVGSGNIGATNLGRALGRKWGLLCFFLDVAKGLIPVLLMGSFLRENHTETGAGLTQVGQLVWLITGTAAIVGHMFPIYLRGLGGKGAATSLGVLLGIWPYFTFSALFALAIWMIVWGYWRYVSLASISAAAGFPLGFLLLIYRMDGWEFERLWPLFVFSCLMTVLVIFRHRSNIVRLLAGRENR
jgi:glycerol-3-phosphate acyltransferase PlsY